MRWLAAGVSGGANVTASSGTRTAAMGTKPRVRGADAPSWSRSIVELRRDHRKDGSWSSAEGSVMQRVVGEGEDDTSPPRSESRGLPVAPFRR